MAQGSQLGAPAEVVSMHIADRIYVPSITPTGISIGNFDCLVLFCMSVFDLAAVGESVPTVEWITARKTLWGGYPSSWVGEAGLAGPVW